jgi:glycosyltransferase involved in cell wall biosynthesis
MRNMLVERKIRILYVLNEFMYGSKVRRLGDFAKGLDSSRFDLEVCGFDIGDEATKEIESLNVPIYQLRLVPERSLKPRLIGQFLRSPFTVSRKNYDIVHSLCYQSVFTEPLIIKLFSKAKFIYTKTNLEWDNHRLNWRLKSRLADRIVSISRATDQVLIKNGFGDKIEKIFTGLDTEFFTHRPDKRKALRDKLGIAQESLVYGCAAQFVELKGHLVLIEAFEKLAERREDIYLLLCGGHHNDGYYRKVLDAIRASRFSENIQLLGTLDDMTGFYSAIDCFVLPSWNENLAYVYIEAMSCGRPAIGCRDGGTLDVIAHDETGYLVEVADAKDLADRMESYARDRSLLKRHGEQGRKRVLALFSRETMVMKHENLYRRILGG